MSENELIFEERFSCEKTMNDPLRQSWPNTLNLSREIRTVHPSHSQQVLKKTFNFNIQLWFWLCVCVCVCTILSCHTLIVMSRRSGFVLRAARFMCSIQGMQHVNICLRPVQSVCSNLLTISSMKSHTKSLCSWANLADKFNCSNSH
jgi:hypothetical protein